MSVVTANSNSQCSLFSKKNPIIRIFCISALLAATVNPDEWSSTVYVDPKIYYNPALPENGQAGRPNYVVIDVILITNF
jgi:hypothetical protein